MNTSREFTAPTESTSTGAELFSAHGKSAAAQVFLWLRNVFVVLAAALFLLTFVFQSLSALRALVYLFGAFAYICEILVLTDCFTLRLPHNELFMPYCFGPLYLIMGVGYLFG